MISEEIKRYLIKVCKIHNSHNVDYLVVGGAAVSHYGFSRPSRIGQSVNRKTDHTDIAELDKIRKGRRRGKGNLTYSLLIFSASVNLQQTKP